MTYKPWPTADQQHDEQGRADVVGAILIDPATGQPYNGTGTGGGGGGAVTVADGADVAQGTTTDAANTSTVMGQLKQHNVIQGAAADANTANTVMGRLTKIRDVLLGFVFDNTDRLKVSLYGKNAAAGDTALLLDALGQMTVEQFIQYQIMQGHGFSATTGFLTTAAANAFICEQLAVNNIAKKVLLFSVVASFANLASDGRVYTASVATADSTLTALTAYNLQPKSATTSSVSTIAGSPASTTQTSGFTGTQSGSFSLAANASYQLLQQGLLYYFANGDTASVEVAVKVPTSGNSGSLTFYWVEWT